jgi:phospholipid transport system substrate-binding protein
VRCNPPRACAWIAVGLASILSAGPTTAANSSLVETLKARQARIDSILSAHPGKLDAATRGTLEEALSGAIDFEAMARAALADWESRSAAERTEYASAFERLIRRSLMRRVDVYRIEGVSYGAETIQGDNGRVETVVRAKEATTEVVWQFVHTGTGWRVSDYSIDGVSTVRNYRRQFTRLIQTRGWNGLIDRIAKRAAEIEGEMEKEADG